jgi:hypothetical protein
MVHLYTWLLKYYKENPILSRQTSGLSEYLFMKCFMDLTPSQVTIEMNSTKHNTKENIIFSTF